MGKNNNKLLSLFLLTSIVTTTSIFSGILSISKERYERSEAAGSYKVVYLSVPNQVVDNSGNNPKTWDKDNDLHVNEFGGKDGIYDAGDEMSRVDTNLYAYVLNSVYSSTSFNFTAYVDGVLLRSMDLSASRFQFNGVNNSANLLTLAKYGVTSRANAGNWTGYTVTTADAFAKTFLAVVGSGTCDRENGNTTLSKLQAVWSEMSALYTSLNDENKKALHDESIEGTEPINKFAKLYNYIYWKYDTGVGTNFINRIITPLASVTRYTPTSISEMDTSNLIIAISSGLAVISITGLYFYIRKRKQD